MADIDKIKGSFNCDTNGEYVVLSGNKLHIFRPDGSLVATRKDIPHPDRITFLSGNRLLLCSSKAVFHMIDLCTGTDLWTAPHTKSYTNLDDLAISPDEQYAYTCDTGKNGNFISRLDLQTQDVYSHDMLRDIGATRGIVCDEEGVPCLLKTLHETIGGKPYSQNGVRLQDYDAISACRTTNCKTKWSFEGNRSAFCFFGSADRVLLTDFHVYEPATGMSFNLLENDPDWQPPDSHPLSSGHKIWQQYMLIMWENANMIIDIPGRKVVAQYVSHFLNGCIVGNEYWICQEGKIRRKPFPAMEAVEPVKRTATMDWYYATRPELW